MDEHATSENEFSGSAELGKSVSIVEARTHFGELVSRTALLHERVFVTRHGKRVAALVSAEDAELLEAIEDRLDLEAVRKVRRDIASHGTIPLIQLVQDLGL